MCLGFREWRVWMLVEMFDCQDRALVNNALDRLPPINYHPSLHSLHTYSINKQANRTCVSWAHLSKGEGRTINDHDKSTLVDVGRMIVAKILAKQDKLVNKSFRVTNIFKRFLRLILNFIWNVRLCRETKRERVFDLLADLQNGWNSQRWARLKLKQEDRTSTWFSPRIAGA